MYGAFASRHFRDRIGEKHALPAGYGIETHFRLSVLCYYRLIAILSAIGCR
jgi:hypothetical protein